MLTILRLPAVKKATGLGRSSIYAKLKMGGDHYDPTFPRPIRLGLAAVGWRSDELHAWLESRQRAT
ncbi:AlpA family transcriptional regulator [Pelomonas sp. CA6]|uniref:helix-turn-helix transcriptional regulator n=1 Tax=Pelomonas sp. CA6 TaxID=2907999 RepID=UPI001F4C5163|nr:AlpA family phage regulatory protein [Pelomonas sp. CA6]MCH7343941.1 AlpA family transcriptional regulator [Pelomonas sp. CA6]